MRFFALSSSFKIVSRLQRRCEFSRNELHTPFIWIIGYSVRRYEIIVNILVRFFFHFLLFLMKLQITIVTIFSAIHKHASNFEVVLYFTSRFLCLRLSFFHRVDLVSSKINMKTMRKAINDKVFFFFCARLVSLSDHFE